MSERRTQRKKHPPTHIKNGIGHLWPFGKPRCERTGCCTHSKRVTRIPFPPLRNEGGLHECSYSAWAWGGKTKSWLLHQPFWKNNVAKMKYSLSFTWHTLIYCAGPQEWIKKPASCSPQLTQPNCKRTTIDWVIYMAFNSVLDCLRSTFFVSSLLH